MDNTAPDDRQPYEASSAWRQREGHWPHASRRAQDLLDLDMVEAHAVRILARGLRSQRLMAFVGAGASMAYGRLTWNGLMATLYAMVEERAQAEPKSSGAKAWDRICRSLWGNDIGEFLKFEDHAVKAQVLWASLRLFGAPSQDQVTLSDPSYDLADPLLWETKFQLEDFHGFVDWVLASGSARRIPDALRKPEERLKARLEQKKESKELGEAMPGRKQAFGLRGVLDALMPDPSSAPISDSATTKLLKALHRQSLEQDSPIRQLALDWGIRRFLTTNYDHEIERGLGQLGYARSISGPEVHDNLVRTLNFGRRETGPALSFALDGPRRHAEVLHLHGDVAHQASLIVTEQQYQSLYLDDHPTRDLVTNATLASFAANPILFVGSGVNEDDVTRPMRQFMSGEGHRRDRLAVALFPADKAPKALAQQKMRLLLKYGVHVVHFGWEEAGPKWRAHSSDIAPRGESWLGRLSELHGGFEALHRNFDKSAPAEGRADSIKRFAELCEHWKELRAPTLMEGVDLKEIKALDVASTFNRLQASLNRAIPEQEKMLREWNAEFGKFIVRLSIMRDWLTSQFLCAKLLNLRAEAVACIADDSLLALPYRRPPDVTGKGSLQVVSRHGVSLAHELLESRFEQIDPDVPRPTGRRAFDEGIESLCATLRNTTGIRNEKGRRVIVICGARGYGKGGQADRLVAQRDAHSENYPALRKVTAALGCYRGGQSYQVLHVNLSFSNELGPIISQLGRVLNGLGLLDHEIRKPRRSDQLSDIEKGLRSIQEKGAASGRIMLVMGNAGVLFDADGKPKNGQIWRLLRMLMSERFASVPLDILLYVGESQIPAHLRKSQPLPGTVMQVADKSLKQDERLERVESRRRLDRLNIRADPLDSHVVIHTLSRTRVSELAAAYFPGLADRVGFTVQSGKSREKLYAAEGSEADELSRRLYAATGGSRFAITVLLALVDSEPETNGKVGAAEKALIEDALTALSGPPSGSAIETVIEFALDRWARRHLIGQTLPEHAAPKFKSAGSGSAKVLKNLMGAQPNKERWALAFELLWHLGAFSHPVEAEVLLACPRVRVRALALCPASVDSTTKLARGESIKTEEEKQGDRSESLLMVVRAMLELLTHWCLTFRVRARPLPPGVNEVWKKAAEAQHLARERYAPHKHMQRHVMRLMGGRNIESTQWDQFTITTYASLPDEAPILRPEVHQTLTEVLRTLTEYPAAQRVAGQDSGSECKGLGGIVKMVLEADRIRAAYYLVRSTYSLGVIAHLSPKSADAEAGCGHLEEYRRLVRWITHAARYWQERYGIGTASSNDEKRLTDTARAWSSGSAKVRGPDAPSGVFYPGELVWLYNECGVISLAQGTLHDAEQMLTLAERAAKQVEGDDSGSLHVRIRLHSATVQIERGRPQRARLMLEPIANRVNGHPVPPLLALFYVGQIHHLGGSYKEAEGLYNRALDGLRSLPRSRAAAFVLISKADLAYALRPHQLPAALSMANEAISLAQQGGHEDVRMLAIVARCRINIEARQPSLPGQPGLFEQLSAAERYAVRMDIPRLSCEVHELRARLLLSQGEYQLSAKNATTSLEIAALYDLKIKKARGLLTLAQIFHQRGEFDDARSLATTGRDIANSCDYYTCVRGFKDLELALDADSRDPLPSRFHA